MKLARYIGSGQIAIVDEPAPSCPAGGLLVKTEASGLCSGELMDWYMDAKIPHVLGHEVAGIVVESQEPRFEVGRRVFPHHHAPCMRCEMCAKKLYVHCPQWKRTKLDPGGMAEYFAVPAENLTDTFDVSDLRPIDAALIEPLACVVKSVRAADLQPGRPANAAVAIIGLGAMGLMHSLLLPGSVGYDTNTDRLRHAKTLDLDARTIDAHESADVVFVCPGNKAALDFAIRIVNPGGRIVLFAPMPPGEETPVDLNRLYFRDVQLANSYSCGPNHTAAAAGLLRAGLFRAEHVVSDFIEIAELPKAYDAMKRGDIHKAMVLF
jgi:L-iditol 2-dehydrogenase